MNIAIEGCLHGELDEVYKQLNEMQKAMNIKIDLLIICGDFQALRDQTDLDYLHCPKKYKTMGNFYQYFQQIKKPPMLTIFIGGNHEAVNYMRDLYFGGWVAKNIYYLGQAGSIYVKKDGISIRITGMSGIYNHRDFQYTLKTQKIPLYGGDRISAYHIKQLQCYRLQLLSRIGIMKRQEPQTYGLEDKNFDIFLSHDWPKNVALYGKIEELYKYKPFLKKQIDQGTFGSPPAQRLMKLSRPSYWFSAHMHVKYASLFAHNQKQYTHFLSLDKCVSKRSCIQILRFDQKQSFKQKLNQPNTLNQQIRIELDKSWLAVLALTKDLQQKGQILYKYQNKQLKLTNTAKMNQLILAYPQCIKNLKIQNLSPPFLNQLQQTQLLLKSLSIESQIFKGIIFPKGYFEQQYNTKQQKQQIQKKQENYQNEDQIQLDL